MSIINAKQEVQVEVREVDIILETKNIIMRMCGYRYIEDMFLSEDGTMLLQTDTIRGHNTDYETREIRIATEEDKEMLITWKVLNRMCQRFR